jgi:hypothetical protein
MRPHFVTHPPQVIVGDLVHASDSVIVITVTEGGGGSFDVKGTVVLSGSLQIVITSQPVDGQRIQIIQAGNLTGEFSDMTLNENYEGSECQVRFHSCVVLLASRAD